MLKKPYVDMDIKSEGRSDKVYYVVVNYISHIKTHGSESQGQEEAGLRDEPVSYLQVALL